MAADPSLSPHSLTRPRDHRGRLTVIIVLLVAAILGILTHSVITFQGQKADALVVDLAGRQRMLHQKHMKEVLLASQGIGADYHDTRQILQDTLDALSEGGPALLTIGEPETVNLPSAPSEAIRNALEEQRRLTEQFIAKSDAFLGLPKTDPTYSSQLNALLDLTEALYRTSNEAVQLFDDALESKAYAMVAWELGLVAFLGLFGLLLTRQIMRTNRELVREIVERERAERDSQRTQTLMSSIVENLPDMVFVKDADDHRFVRFNKAGEELLGYPREELIGKNDYDFFPQDEADFFWVKDREVLDGGQLIEIPEEPIKTRLKGMRMLHTKKVPILRGDGTPEYLLGISEDITERKRAEQQEQSYQKMLSTISRIQSQFIEEVEPRIIFDNLLTELLLLSESEYGFIGEVLQTADGKLYLKTHAISNIAWNDETRALYERLAPNLEFHNLNTLFGNVITTGKPVIANDPWNDPRRSGMPQGHPPLNTFLGLPFYKGERLLGMVGVANKPGGYDQDIVQYLEPFVATCGNIIEAYRNEQRRCEAERRLRESEERFALAVRGSDAGIWDWDLKTNKIYFSPRWKSILGYDEHEVKDDISEWESRIHPQDHERALSTVHSYLEGRCSQYELEHRLRHKDGSYRWVLARGVSLLDDQSKPYRMAGSYIDITERKRAEENLRFTQFAIDRAAIATFWVRPNARFMYVNAATCKSLGYTTEELLSLDLFDVDADQTADAWPTVWADIKKLGSLTFESRHRRKDGKLIPVVITANYLEFQGLEYICGFAQDITERKEAEAALREMNLALSKAMPAIAQIDAKGNFVQANPIYAEMLGYGQDEMHGLSWDATVQPDDHPIALAAMERMARCGTAEFEARAVRKDGSTFYKHVMIVKGLGQAGDPVGHHCFMRDITERKQAEEAVRESQAKLHRITDAIPGAVYQYRLSAAGEQSFLYFSRGIEELLGLSREEAQESIEKVWGLGYPDDEAALFASIQESARTLRPWSHEFRVVVGGTIKWLRGSSVPEHPMADGSILWNGILVDITERKRAEEKLRELQRRHQLLLESAGEGVFGLDCEGRATFINPAAARMLGYDVDELIGRPMHVTVHAKKADGSHYSVLGCPMCAAFRDGSVHRVDSEVLWRKDGTCFPIEYTSTPIQESLQVIGAVVTFRDITERKRGEEVLERYERIVSSSSDLMAFLDAHYRYMAVNQSYADAFGRSWADIVGRSVAELMGAERFETRLKPYLDRCLFGEHVTFKHWLDLPKMGLRYLEVHYFPYRESSALVSGVVVNVRDITDQHRAEDALRESEERYRALYDDNPCMCFTVSADGTVLSVNEFGAKQLGYQVEELVGQPVFGVFHEEDVDSVKRHVATSLQDPGRVYHWEFRKVRKDGVVMWVKETVRVVQAASGEPVLLIVCEDVTERRSAEEKLRQSEERTIAALRHSDALKSALLSSVSHELRTPLTAIKSMVSSLPGDGKKVRQKGRSEFLEGIHQEIDYLNRLVDNLLDMSKIEAGTLEPRREWHLCEDLVEGAIRRVGKPLQVRSLDIWLPDGLPSIFVDGVEIQQVLVNLLDNAIKYSPEGTKISLKASARSHEIEVRVSNTGTGIPPEDVDRVFDRFYRVKAGGERVIPGTGLGLAICKGIIEAHGGKIWVQSEPGVETTFGFTLPSGTAPILSSRLERSH